MIKNSIRHALKAPGPRLLLSVVLLFLLTFGVYWNSFHGEFVFDDLSAITRNGQLNLIETIGDVWNLGFQSRWLTMATFGLNFLWGGWDPYGFHVVNTLIHWLNASLVFLIALQVSSRNWFPAFAAAAVFAVHPLLTEGVASVAGRFSSLCAPFYFAAVLTFLKGMDADSLRNRALWFGATAMGGYLAYLSKQEALALPVALAALYWIRRDRFDWRIVVPLLLVPAVLLIAFRRMFAGLISGAAANEVLVTAGFDSVLGPLAYARTYVAAILGYYGPRFVLPRDLSVDPYVPVVEFWYSPEFLFALCVLALGGWILFRPHRFDRLAVTGLALVLVSPLTAYAALPLADIVLEHRAYIPGLGVALIIGWGIARLGSSRPPLVGGAVLAIVLTLYSAMAIQRNREWRSGIELWEAAERVSPEKLRPHLNLAEAYQRVGRTEDALVEFRHGLDLAPSNPVALSNLGALYIRQQRLDLAEPVLRKLTSENPDFVPGFVNLSGFYMAKGDFDQAIATVARALEIDPQYAPAHINMGDALTEKEDYAAAAESYILAMRYRPDSADGVRLNLAVSYHRSGDHDAARREFQSLTGTSLAASAYQNLGVMENELGNLDAALDAFRQSALLRPNSEMFNAIGGLYIRKGMPDRAISELQKALERRPDNGQAHINMALAYQNKGQIDEAKRILEEFIQTYPGSRYRVEARARVDALD